MTFIGEIVRTERDLAYVKTFRPESCQHCSQKNLCRKELQVCAVNEIGAEPGDLVTVEISEDQRVLAVFSYIFLVPLLILFLCCALYTVFSWLALAGIPLLCFYYLVLRRIDRKTKIQARIVSAAASPDAFVLCDDKLKRSQDHEG